MILKTFRPFLSLLLALCVIITVGVPSYAQDKPTPSKTDVDKATSKTPAKEMCTKDGLLQSKPTATDHVELCEIDLMKMQRQVLIINNIQLQQEQLKAQIEALNSKVDQNKQALGQLIQDMRDRYGLKEDEWPLNPDLTFDKKKKDGQQ